MTRICIVVSSNIKPGLAQLIASGEAPRRDYLELQKLLGAQLLVAPPQPDWRQRVLRKVGGNALLMAWIAWSRRDEYDIVITDQESTGLLLALLFKLGHAPQGHVMISHYLSPLIKQLFFHMLRVQSHIDCTVCYSSAQLKLAREKLGLRRDQAALALHPADSKFWRPAASWEVADDASLLREAGLELPPETQVVCSAGLEFRDYETLIAAAQKLPPSARVIIAAASPWSRRGDATKGAQLPPNVQRVSLTPRQLRALYRRSDVVAIPLFDVDFQAGSLVAYEAMACGRPVVISQTRGQSDIVKDGCTGYYVPPGNADALADMLNLLLSYPSLASHLGCKARVVVENELNLDRYLDSMQTITRGVAIRHAPEPSPAVRQAI